MSATLNQPQGVAAGADGDIYIADTGNNVVRRVDASGTISTFAGGASAVCAHAIDVVGDGCLASQITLSAPTGVAVNVLGQLYVSDTGNNRVRVVPHDGGEVVTAVGGAAAVCTAATDAVGDGCNALQATLNASSQVRFDVAGNLYIADAGNNMVRRVDLAAAGQKIIVSVAGNGQAGSAGDGGPASSAQLSAPSAIALDGAGSLYIADTGSDAVRVVNATTGNITTLAGTDGSSGSGTLPATATASLLSGPAGIEVAGSGALYVSDTGNNRVLGIDRNALKIDFGAVNVTSTSPEQLVTLTNTGTADLALGTPLVAATGSTGEFLFTPAAGNGCAAGQSLSMGAQCVMSAQFAPTVTGNHSATYTFAGSTGINTPAPSVTLFGGGAVLVATSTAVTVTTPASGNPQYGQSAAVTVTVTPASQGTSAISGTIALTVDGSKQAPVAITTNASGNGVASITLPTLNAGQHSIVATYNGDAVYALSSSSLTLTVDPGPPDYSLTASASSVTVATGGIGQINITITPSNNTNLAALSGNITLSCGSMPANAVCTFTPSVVSFTPATDQPVTIPVRLWTNIAPGSFSQADAHSGGKVPLFAELLCPVGLLLLACTRLKKVRVAGLLLLFLGLAGSSMGCVKGPGASPQATTPTGTSTMMIQASGPGTQSHAVAISFTVVP